MTQTTAQANRSIPAILVSRPGIMQQSLRVALEGFNGIMLVALSGDGLTALRQIKHHRPGVLVIDSNLLDEEIEALIAAVKDEQPKIRCLAFVQSIRQKRQMMILGADAVALRDGPPQQFRAALAQLAQEARELQG